MRGLKPHASLARRASLNASLPEPSVAHASSQQSPPALPEERVRRILGIVESSRTFTIRDSALELNLSPAYLQRLFKHQTGVCMGEWLSERRLQQFAVMIPRTMKFSSRSPAFEVLATGDADYQVRAITQMKAGDGPSFEISGTGALPPIQGRAKAQEHAQSPPNQTTPTPARAPLPSLQRIAARSELPQSSSQLRVLGALTVFLLGACALLIWRTRKARRITAA